MVVVDMNKVVRLICRKHDQIKRKSFSKKCVVRIDKNFNIDVSGVNNDMASDTL